MFCLGRSFQMVMPLTLCPPHLGFSANVIDLEKPPDLILNVASQPRGSSFPHDIVLFSLWHWFYSVVDFPVAHRHPSGMYVPGLGSLAFCCAASSDHRARNLRLDVCRGEGMNECLKGGVNKFIQGA